MSHIRKNIQLAKTYEDDNMVIDEALAKQELIARERIRIAIIKMKVLELANTPEWINSKFAGEATEGRLVGKSKFAGEATEGRLVGKSKFAGEATEGRLVGKSKFAGEATEGRLVGKYIPISVNTQNLPERRPNDFPQN